LTPTKPSDWDAATLFAGMFVITDPAQVAKLSHDYYTFSPVLQPKLTGKTGSAVVRPANEAEVLRAAATCVKYKIPLTVRGAGTGNYGQCVSPILARRLTLTPVAVSVERNCGVKTKHPLTESNRRFDRERGL